MKLAKELIQEFCAAEYEEDADFSDLHAVALAHSATGDGEHTIQVNADLIDFKISYNVDGNVVDAVACESLDELNEYLGNLEFDGLIGRAESEFESRRQGDRSRDRYSYIEQVEDGELGYLIWDNQRNDAYLDNNQEFIEFSNEDDAKDYAIGLTGSKQNPPFPILLKRQTRAV